MRLGLPIVGLLILAPLAAWGQPTIEGSYTLHEQGQRRSSRAVVVAGESGLELRIFKPGGATLVFAHQAEDPSSTSWTFSRVRSAGLTGRLALESGQAEEIQLRRASGGKLTGERGEGVQSRRLALVPKRRLLVVLSAYRVYADRVHARYQSLRLEAYYGLKGYETQRVAPQNWEELIQHFESARKNPYERVVFITHGGYHGPVLGYEDEDDDFPFLLPTVFEADDDLPGTRQVSPDSESKLWPAMVTALKEATTAKAKIYVSACHAGGGDAEEREAAGHMDLRREVDFDSAYPATDSWYVPWVSRLADATQRVVVGPAGLTSWHSTYAGVMALEAGAPGPLELYWGEAGARAFTTGSTTTPPDGMAERPLERISISPSVGEAGKQATLELEGAEPGPVTVYFGSIKARLASTRFADGVLRIVVELPKLATDSSMVVFVGAKTLKASYRIDGGIEVIELEGPFAPVSLD